MIRKGIKKVLMRVISWGMVVALLGTQASISTLAADMGNGVYSENEIVAEASEAAEPEAGDEAETENEAAVPEAGDEAETENEAAVPEAGDETDSESGTSAEAGDETDTENDTDAEGDDSLEDNSASTEEEASTDEKETTDDEEEVETTDDEASEDTVSEEILLTVSLDNSLPDNDVLFEEYVKHIMFEEQGLDASEYLMESDEDSFSEEALGGHLYNNLSELERYYYDACLKEIKKIASGERDSTIIEVENRGLDQSNYNNFMNALRKENPYEMYWCDLGGGPNAQCTDGIWHFPFPVCEAYRGSDICSTDKTKTSATNTAVENAKAIVKVNAAESDYEKIVAYKEYICNAVTYNREAASSSSVPYGDPWQLIYVFDGNPDTNVVCEGYAKAFKYLCDLSTFDSGNIECILMVGIMVGSTNSGGHMWNIIRMDDCKYYMVDVTNSDSESVGKNGGLFLNGYKGKVDDDTYVDYGNRACVPYYYNYIKSVKFYIDAKLGGYYAGTLWLNWSETDYDPNNLGDSGTIYTVSLDANGGSCSKNVIYLKDGDVYGELPVATLNNHAFLGWYTAKTGGTKITDTSVFTSGKDITLYAHYEAQEITVEKVHIPAVSSIPGFTGGWELTTGNIRVAYDGTFVSADVDELLYKMNQMRYEACVQGVYDINLERALTVADYKPLTWSIELETLARQRAVEQIPFGMTHTRPNNANCRDLACGLAGWVGENLAGNGDAHPLIYALDTQWYSDEKKIYDDAMKTNSTPRDVKGAGHYLSIVSSMYSSVGIACYSTGAIYYSAMRLSSYTNTTGYNPASGNTKGYAEINKERVSSIKITTSTSGTYTVGNTINLQASATLTNSREFEIVEGCNWSSNNTAVATVSSEGVVSCVGNGTAEITCTAAGRKSSVTITVGEPVEPKSVEELEVTEISATYDYTGNEIVPEPVVKDGTKTLVKDTDYSVSYTDNKEKGTAKVTITGLGNYNGQKSVNFEIVKYTITITAKDMHIKMGDAIPSTYAFSISGLNESDKLTKDPVFACSITNTDSVGVYDIVPSDATAPVKYDIEYVNGKLYVDANYKVTFDMRGHGTQVSPVTGITEERVISAPEAPTETGYTFGGWYKEASCINEWNFATDIVNANITLYAKWTVNTYPIILFPCNGSGGIPTILTINYGMTYAEIPGNPLSKVPVKAHHIFLGWYTAEEDGTKIELTDTFTELSGIALYAHWKEVKYTLAFDVNGGNGMVAPKSLNYYDAFTFPDSSNGVTRKGYTLLGWSTDSSSAVAEYEAGANFTEGITDEDGSTVTVYAVWEKDFYVVNFSDGNEGVYAPISIAYGQTFEEAFAIAGEEFYTASMGEDYIFLGWYTEAEGGNKVEKTDSYMLTSGMTLYAHFEKVDSNVIEVGSIGAQTFTGKAVKPVPVVRYSGKELVYGTDFTVSYVNNVNVGTATATVTGAGNYTGKVKVNFVIEPFDITTADSSVFVANDIVVKENGKVQKGNPVIKYNGVRLVKGTDYKLTYPSVEEGAYKTSDKYQVVVEGIGNYTGTISVFEYITKDIPVSKLVVTTKKLPYIDKDTPVFPDPAKGDVVVKYGDKVLKYGVDYDIEHDDSYDDHTSVGKHTFILKGIEASLPGKVGYTGELEVTYEIVGTPMKNVVIKYNGKVVADTLNITETYNDFPHMPNDLLFEVHYKTASGKLLSRGLDYEIEYVNNTNAGTASVVFRGINGYTGSVKRTFTISPYNIKKDLESKTVVTFIDDNENAIGIGEDLSIAMVKGGVRPAVKITYDLKVLTTMWFISTILQLRMQVR